MHKFSVFYALGITHWDVSGCGYEISILCKGFSSGQTAHIYRISSSKLFTDMSCGGLFGLAMNQSAYNSGRTGQDINKINRINNGWKL
jgi:hypothetical protein